ncbi:MAG: hypothetical protein WCS96_06840, partial [Victivallales bacterium]
MNTTTLKSTPLVLRTQCDILGFDPATARLVSCRSHAVPDMEMIAASQDDPAFVIRYLDDRREFQNLLSTVAQSVTVTVQTEPDGAKLLTAHYSRIGGLDLHLEFSVRAMDTDRFSRWRLTIENNAGLELVHVEFPFVVCADDLGGNPADTFVVFQGHHSGRLLRDPRCDATADHPRLGADIPASWDLTRGHSHYPGLTFAQFLACHNERIGLYLACEDT